MFLKVRGEKDLKSLSLIDINTGINYAREFISATSGFDDWQQDIDGCYVVEPAEYKHWENVFSENLRALITLNEHKTLIDDEDYQEIYNGETRGFEHYSEVTLDNLDRITTGTVSCKMVSVNDENGLSLRKAVDVFILKDSELGNNLELIGTFVLNTKHNKYTMTISVMANYTIVGGDIEVEIIPDINDSPIFFSQKQIDVIDGIYIKEAKKYLAKHLSVAVA